MKPLKSPRMDRVLGILLRHEAPTTKEIETWAGVAAARDYVRRLRDKGYNIETIERGTNDQGARVVCYRLHRGSDLAVRDLFGDRAATGVTYTD